MNIQDDKDDKDGFELTMTDHWAIYLTIEAQSLLPKLKWGEGWGEFNWIDREFKKMTRWPKEYEPPIGSFTYINFKDNYLL